MRLTRVLFRRKLPVRRNHPINFNNAWQEGRTLPLTDTDDRKVLTSMGIPVVSPQDVIQSSYVMPYEVPEYDPPKSIIRENLPKDESHPLWKDRPVHTFGDRTYFPVNHQLDLAKNLTKTVELDVGLPSRLIQSIEKTSLSEEALASVEDMIKETQMFDAIQKKLPFNYKVPFIGWHPVNDRMSSKTPYPVTMSWQYKEARKYGIPLPRSTLNLTRGLFRLLDQFCPEAKDILHRVNHEKQILRQYFNRLGSYTRVSVHLPFSVWSPHLIKPYADTNTTKSSISLKLPDIHPMEPQVGLWPINVYREENNLPIMDGSLLRAHTLVNNYTNPVPDLANEDQFAANSLMLSFASALGQARLLYGSQFSDVLPEPITVHFINTDGKKFHISAFQLNTLELSTNDGVKNIFWHEKEMSSLYDVCEYVQGRPMFEGLNSSLFKKLLAMYAE
ncbi:large ribosomal subunit protein mL37 [Lepeophtheirus salmonis]|uniref:large ribosomal subunit protein mL37 n=1 Tax=Lepeophtheirus salmonis TaxID=72036 RepID=UPI001AE755CC|nr:39S ribosomal protein L37, mitochondrial-like [Lepeophtheirus salmonis]